MPVFILDEFNTRRKNICPSSSQTNYASVVSVSHGDKKRQSHWSAMKYWSVSDDQYSGQFMNTVEFLAANYLSNAEVNDCF